MPHDKNINESLVDKIHFLYYGKQKKNMKKKLTLQVNC